MQLHNKWIRIARRVRVRFYWKITRENSRENCADEALAAVATRFFDSIRSASMKSRGFRESSDWRWRSISRHIIGRTFSFALQIAALREGRTAAIWRLYVPKTIAIYSDFQLAERNSPIRNSHTSNHSYFIICQFRYV